MHRHMVAPYLEMRCGAALLRNALWLAECSYILQQMVKAGRSTGEKTSDGIDVHVL